jgi:hypothetical protein
MLEIYTTQNSNSKIRLANQGILADSRLYQDPKNLPP